MPQVPTEVRERVTALREAIEKYRYSYHVLDTEEIPESARDALMHELSMLEERYPELVTDDSPTQRVAGTALPEFKKVPHVVPQWSFNDIFNEEEARAFDVRIRKVAPTATYVCELKIDGLKIVFTYEKGKLVNAATRGDGVVGEDVTMNIRTIQSVPLVLNRPLDVIVEGEVWMAKSALKRLNKEREKAAEPPFANPRNAAAGAIRQLDPKIAAARKLDTFIYELDQTTEAFPATQWDELEYLRGLGFKVNRRAGKFSDIEGRDRLLERVAGKEAPAGRLSPRWHRDQGERESVSRSARVHRQGAAVFDRVQVSGPSRSRRWSRISCCRSAGPAS